MRVDNVTLAEFFDGAFLRKGDGPMRNARNTPYNPSQRVKIEFNEINGNHRSICLESLRGTFTGEVNIVPRRGGISSRTEANFEFSTKS